MQDLRIDHVDGALSALDQADPQYKAALWQWACLEMLHETLTAMHQLSHRAGVAELVADTWLAPVDVIAPEQPFLERAALADPRVQAFALALNAAASRQSRADLWRSGYASAVQATLQGMQALAGKHRIDARLPTHHATATAAA
ncbi:hypothetical protein [Xanthomonas sp. SHU 199]|uniref:hypothetical protein n=1 Tax=Xanthomonas sp. SHU 199 TaxID=1591174 RepID=UPI00035D6B13|nr:hypothetical protein [Xanthomonas sp. SHU 199]